MLHGANSRCKVMGLKYDIDIDFLRSKYNGKCELSGIEFDLSLDSGNRNPFRPSLDKIDSNGGYTKDNVRIILWGLNFALSDFGLDVYLKMAKAVIETQNKKLSY